MSSNPFVVGQPVPPERFVGRTSQIDTAFDQILQAERGNLAIWGGSGMGKTSFLELLTAPPIWQLQGYNHSKAVIVLVNCLSLSPFTAYRFWRRVLSLIKDNLDSYLALKNQVETLLTKETTTIEDLLWILRQLGQQDKFLVLLADDYDVAFRPHTQYTEADIEVFLSECRSVANSSQERKYISMIVASSRPLNELGPKLTPDKSPWYNHYLFQSLKPLTDAEVTALLAGMPMTFALREGIRDIADGNPALLQNAGHLLYRELRSGQVPSPVSFAQEFQNATQQFFQATWELSTEIEQTLLMLIALVRLEGRLQNQRYSLSGIDNIFSQKEIELNILETRGVIKRSDSEVKMAYCFASSLMEWWVVKKIQNSDESELQARQKIFLNLMSTKQAEKVTIAIRWLWQHKDQVPSILEWIGKVVAALPKGAIKG